MQVFTDGISFTVLTMLYHCRQQGPQQKRRSREKLKRKLRRLLRGSCGRTRSSSLLQVSLPAQLCHERTMPVCPSVLCSTMPCFMMTVLATIASPRSWLKHTKTGHADHASYCASHDSCTSTHPAACADSKQQMLHAHHNTNKVQEVNV